MVKARFVANVRGVGEVVEVYCGFYKGLIAFEEAGAHLITPRQEVKTRIATASNKHIGRDSGTWTTAGFEYAKGSPVLLRLNSHLMNKRLAKQVVEANGERRYFSTKDTKLYDTSAKQAEQDKNEAPEERNVLILPSRTDFQIAPNNSSSFDVLKFLLRDSKLAGEYFEFNGSNPISVHLAEPNIVDAQTGTLMTQMWFYRIADVFRSNLSGCDRDLVYGARGVRGSAEGASPKNLVGKL